MERFQKQFDISDSSVFANSGINMYNDITDWLICNIGKATQTESGFLTQEFVRPFDLNRVTRIMANHLRIRGERTEFLGNPKFIANAEGEKWKVSYIVGKTPINACEVTVCVDDPTIAVQLKLLFS